MALEIKSAPVLEGHAAVEFYERWATAKEGRSKEEVQEINRSTREFLAKYYNPYKDALITDGLQQLSSCGQTYDFLYDEPDIYSVDDLKLKFA